MRAENGKSVHLIEEQQEFEQLCQGWLDMNFLAFDTEFLRTNTFYPKLGLLQIADSAGCYLIDPHCISSWKEFTSLLISNKIEFCVHSCSEDLNLLHTSINSMPSKLFDSQIAAAFLGFGFSISYQGLVSQIFGVDIPKDETRSDWIKRPLSNAQLKYAANDVCYLLQLREVLWEQLETMKVLHWFEEECANQVLLAEESEREENWKHSYIHISNAWKLTDQNLQKLQQLCFWREVKARKENKPRNWIAKDNDLFNLANINSGSRSISQEDIGNSNISDRRFLSRYGKEIEELLNNDEIELHRIDRTQLNFPLPPNLRKKLKSCQHAIAELAKKLSLAPELLARKRLLQDLVRDFENFGELRWQGELGGWRRELLEPEIAKFFA